MTSRNLFFNLIKEDGKQRLWTLAISLLVFFFSFPVRIALIIGDYQENMEWIDYQDMVSDITVWLSFQNYWIAVLLIMMSLIMGVTSFSYLHSKQKVDFYHGIPVSRKGLFWAHYFNGILIPAIAYMAALVLNFFVAAVNGIAPAMLLEVTISSFLLFLLHYILLYTVTVLAMVLTGNILVGILGTGVLHFYFPCALGVMELYFNEFLHTRYSGITFEKSIFYLLLDKSSAFILFFMNMVEFDSDISTEEKAFRILLALAVTVVLAVLSFWIYKKRGSEAAGKAMAFKASMPVIRIPIVILSSLFGSIFFWFIHESLGWALFGILCGIVLSHCIIEIIYHFDFRKLFTHWKQMIICAVIAIMIFCGFRYDLFMYDQYIPEEDSIESIAISIPNFSNWVSYGYIEKDQWGDYDWYSMDSDEYAFDHMMLKNTYPVLALGRDAVKRNQELYHQGLFMKGKKSFDQSDAEQWYLRYNVKYNFSNGKSKYRSYALYSDEVRPEIIELFEDQDYLIGVYPVLTQTPENTTEVKVSRGERIDVVSRDRNGTDKAMTEKLLLTYQEDLKSLKPETMLKENPIATIQFMTRKQSEVEKKQEEIEDPWKYNDMVSQGFYPIYPSFKRTMKLLKECHVDVDSWSSLENVKKLRIDLDQFKNYETMDFSQNLTITDKEQIARIMKEAIIIEYRTMNPFYMNQDESVRFYAGNRLNEYEIGYSIKIDELPVPLKEEIEKVTKPDEDFR